MFALGVIVHGIMHAFPDTICAEDYPPTNLVIPSKALSLLDIYPVTWRWRWRWRWHYSGHITQGKLILIGRSSGVESLMIDIASKKSLPAPQIQGIYDVCLSPDEQHVASHAPDKWVSIADAEASREVQGFSADSAVDSMCWINNSQLCLVTKSGTLWRLDIKLGPEQIFTAALLDSPTKVHLDFRCGATSDGKWWIIHRRWEDSSESKSKSQAWYSGDIECFESATGTRQIFAGSAFTLIDQPTSDVAGPLIMTIHTESGCHANMHMSIRPLQVTMHVKHNEPSLPTILNSSLQFQHIDSCIDTGPDYAWWIGILPRLQIAVTITHQFYLFIIDIQTGSLLRISRIFMDHQTDCLPVVEGDSVILLTKQGEVRKIGINENNIELWKERVAKEPSAAYWNERDIPARSQLNRQSVVDSKDVPSCVQ